MNTGVLEGKAVSAPLLVPVVLICRFVLLLLLFLLLVITVTLYDVAMEEKTKNNNTIIFPSQLFLLLYMSSEPSLEQMYSALQPLLLQEHLPLDLSPSYRDESIKFFRYWCHIYDQDIRVQCETDVVIAASRTR